MYLIIASFFLTNQILVNAQGYDYDQPPPGVPPKAYPNPTSQGKIILTISTLSNINWCSVCQCINILIHWKSSDEVRFHDPSEFAQAPRERGVEYGEFAQTNQPHSHQEEHGHGIGEAVDKE